MINITEDINKVKIITKTITLEDLISQSLHNELNQLKSRIYTKIINNPSSYTSHLIENLLLRIPVGTFITKIKENGVDYELIKGNKRISSIIEFISTNHRLHLLEELPQFSNKTWNELPNNLKQRILQTTVNCQQIDNTGILGDRITKRLIKQIQTNDL